MKVACLAVLVAACSMAPFASGQTQPSKDGATLALMDPSRMDLAIDSVPLPDLIDYLAETTGKNIVLLVPPSVDASSIIIPRLKLRHVSLEQVLDLVTGLPGAAMGYEISGEGESAIYQVRVDGIDAPVAPPAPMAPLVPGAPMPPTAPMDEMMGGGFGWNPPANEPFLSVIPLERVILGPSPAERVPEDVKRQALLASRTEQALTLIDQAFAMNPQGSAKPEIKLHPESNTLLVKATPQQLQTINQVLSALEVAGPSDLKREMERKAQDLLRDADSMRQRLQQELSSRLDAMKREFERSQESRFELEKRCQELMQQVEQLKAKLQAKEEGATQPQ